MGTSLMRFPFWRVPGGHTFGKITFNGIFENVSVYRSFGEV